MRTARLPIPAVPLAEAGLAPVPRASGRSRKVRFRYAANTILREAAMWWACNSMREAPWGKAAFRDVRDHRGYLYHRAPRRSCGLLDAGALGLLEHAHPLRPKRHTTAMADGRTSTTNKPPATPAARPALLPRDRDRQRQGVDSGSVGCSS